MLKNKLRKFLSIVLILALCFGQLGYIDAYGESSSSTTPVLVITGTGVKNELSFTLDQLKALSEGRIIQNYSSINRVGTKKLQAGDGIKLSYLLGLAGVSDSYAKITFCASDGFQKEFTKDQISGKRYYYPDIFSGSEANFQPAETLISFRSLAVTSGTIDPSQLKDNEGTPPLQLMLGQANIKDVNNSLFVSNLSKIIVGDPLPAAFKIAGSVTEEKSLTIADLKLMNTTTGTYNYTTKAGNKSSVCKGVLLKDILSSFKVSGDGIKVQINTTDSAAYPVKPIDLSEAMDSVKGYLVTYEVDGIPVNSDGKDSTNIRMFRNYGDSSSVIKNVTGITITKESTSINQKSTYKHTSYDSAPYNVDSITSATMTIEGPGLEERQIVTTRQLESMDAGVQRGTYTESIDSTVCDNAYEGVTVEYLLSKVAKLKSNAGNVIFWDKNLKKIGEFSFDSVMSADAAGKKMMIAYGINEVPLMFTSSDPGYDRTKHNDNGCLKLILNSNQTSGGTASFTNVSRIQVNEKDAKGINEHTYSPYDKAKYTYDTVTLTGDAIGKDVVYSVKDLEDLAVSNMNTLGYEGLYSLQNSANYWNNHVLKGVKLYELLLKSGMSSSLPDDTPVQIIAKDGYNVGPFTLGDIKNIDKYGVYVKGMKDPASTGLPVLLSYGADGYPFVSLNTDEGFVNGIDNNGGPIRVTFGQKSLEDINGPNQIKYVSKIIVGSDKNYTAHNRAPYDSLKDNTLNVKVFADGSDEPLKSASFKVSELEDLTISKSTASSSIIRDYYAVKKDSQFENDFYQGVNLAYLIKDKVGLSGIDGTVTFKSNGTDVASIGIDELLKPNNDYSGYFNSVTNINNQKPLLAYGKNGYPLVAGQNEGYLYNSSIDINGRYQNVKNDNGPLAVIIPQSSARPEGMFIPRVDEIVVKLAPDPCSHSKDPYKAYNKNITIKGTGVKKEMSIDALTIEEMIDYITKADYYVLNQANTGESAEYKGVGLYDLLRETAGLQPNAEKIKVTSEDGYTKEYTIQDVIKTNFINEKDNTANLKMMVVYGKNGKPLVPSKTDAGYDAAAGNDGGALKLVVGQTVKGDKNSSNTVKNIKTIEVIAGKMVSWKHDSPMYQQYLDTTLIRVTGSEVQSPVTFTLRQLEALNEGVVRDSYTSSQDAAQFEGIDLKYLISKVVKLKTGIEKPTKITIYSGSKYQRNVDVNQVWNGVVNTKGSNKKIILGYAREGYPFVPKIGDIGYSSKNDGGPIKLIVEENISMWIKATDVIVVGTGEYEKPAVPVSSEWKCYRNDTKEILPDASLRSIMVDKKGKLWLGTYGAGFVTIDSKGACKIYNTSNTKTLLNNTVYSIAADSKGRTWISMGGPDTGKGVACIDTKGVWRIYNTKNSRLPDNYVNTIVPDSKGGVWFGTGNGAAYLDKNNKWSLYKSKMAGKSVNIITLDKKGGIWFGCYPNTVDAKKGIYSGGYSYLSRAGKWTVYKDSKDTSFGGNWVRSISIDYKGGVYITRSGNIAGGGKIDYIDAKGVRHIYDDKQMYSALPAGDSIRIAAADTKGGLWMGTMKSGVIYRNVSGKITVYNSENQSFVNSKWDNVYTMSVDASGAIWIGTNGGAAKKIIK